MTTPRPRFRRHEMSDSLARLDSMVVMLTDPEEWRRRFLVQAQALAEQTERLASDDQEGEMRAAAELYRLCYRATVLRLPKEWCFWHLCTGILTEAHTGPEALLNRPEYLSPLWDRLDAIRQQHGWPEEDGNGNAWRPEDHLDSIPDDHAAWKREFEEKAGAMEAATFRVVCEKYGVPEIADLRENDPREFERRMEAGLRHDEAMSAQGDG